MGQSQTSFQRLSLSFPRCGNLSESQRSLRVSFPAMAADSRNQYSKAEALEPMKLKLGASRGKMLAICSLAGMHTSNVQK